MIYSPETITTLDADHDYFDDTTITSTSSSSIANATTLTTSITSASNDSPPLPPPPPQQQQLVDTKKYYCPFFERGHCRKSSQCTFSHDQRASTKIPNHYCHFYLANQCFYGQECKFRHSEPSPPPSPTTATTAIVAALIAGGGGSLETTSTSTSSDIDEAETSSFERPHHNRPRPALSIRQQAVATTSSSPASYASAAAAAQSESAGTAAVADDSRFPLCPYATTQGVCPFPYNICPYKHGLVCDLCSRACLYPDDIEQQRQHREDCLKEHEREMELSFAVQRSKDKVCGICMDTVIEKKPITSSRFGILEKCNHVFCLDCIRKWRGTKQFDNRTIRACPECRVSSDFVVPSKFWVEDQDEKEKLIRDYKTALKSKPCRYFDEGKGECPFAGSCFYKHAYPDGRLAKSEPPRPRRRLQGARGSATRERMTNLILWNILTSGEDDWHLSTEELDTFYFDRDWDPELTEGEEGDSDIDIEW